MKLFNRKLSPGKINKPKIAALGRSLLKRIMPLPISGGLSVSDSAFRYCRFRDDGTIASEVSLRLPPGIVEGGRIKDRPLVVAALEKLRSLTDIRKNEKGEVVLSLPGALVYSQIFSLPDLADASLAEAADLNIRMISPVNLNEAYYGYQVIGVPDSGFGKEILAAFISASASDEWALAVKEVGFLPVATEFHSLSLVRLAGVEVDPRALHLAVSVTPEGVSLVLIKNRNLVFDYFFSWASVQGGDKRITVIRLRDVLFAEINKVVNFSLSRFGGEVQSIVVNAEGLEEEIISGIKNTFPKIKVSKLILPEGRPAGYAVAIGAAVRGRMLRSADEMISLSSITVIKDYEQNRIFSAIVLWRRMAVVSLSFLLLVMSVANFFLFRMSGDTGADIVRELSPVELAEYGRLKALAADFNSLVSSVAAIRFEENKISPFIERIAEYAGNDIRFTRFAFQSFSQPVTISGVAPSMDAVLNFHKRMLQAPGISGVELPLSAVQVSLSGETSFVMSFRTTSLDLPASAGTPNQPSPALFEQVPPVNP